MTRMMFSVFDSATNQYLEPFFAHTIEEAIRSFRVVLSKPDHPFARFPDDYTLFQLGSIDLSNGTMHPLKTPHSLGLALTFLPKQETPDNA